MKKMTALLLLLSLLLTGCSTASDSTEPTETAPADTFDSSTEESTETVSAPMPMITVSVPVQTEETTAEDSTVIFRSIRQNMQLVMPDQDVADRIIIDFLTRIEKTSASQLETLAAAQNDYVMRENWVPYVHSITYTPMRVDQGVLSLYGSYFIYSGAAHGMHSTRAANYNVLTGDVLTLGSIIVNEASVDKICELVIGKLQAIAEEKYLRDDFEETVRQRFTEEESYDEEWYFSASGLCFYFDPYEIGPFSSGVITAEIPYTELIGIIDDAFFPPEQDAAAGTVKTASAEEADMTSYTRISEVVLQNEAPMYVIYTEGTVQNLSITMNDAVLNGEYTVFAAQSLCEGDAVVIQAKSNMFRRLNIIYESNGQTVTLPLITE